jgi:hypothetical protein
MATPASCSVLDPDEHLVEVEVLPARCQHSDQPARAGAEPPGPAAGRKWSSCTALSTRDAVSAATRPCPVDDVGNRRVRTHRALGYVLDSRDRRPPKDAPSIGGPRSGGLHLLAHEAFMEDRTFSDIKSYGV